MIPKFWTKIYVCYVLALPGNTSTVALSNGTTSLHHFITAPLRHFITTSLHHYITFTLPHFTTSPLYHYKTSLNHCNTASLNHYITTSLHHFNTEPPNSTSSLHRDISVSLLHFNTTSLHHFIIQQNLTVLLSMTLRLRSNCVNATLMKRLNGVVKLRLLF